MDRPSVQRTRFSKINVLTVPNLLLIFQEFHFYVAQKDSFLSVKIATPNYSIQGLNYQVHHR